MDIILKDLTITSYDSSDIDKVRFTKEFKNDNLVKNYLYKDVDEFIKKSENYPDLHMGCGYIVKDDKDLIGYIKASRGFNLFTLDVDYGIHPAFRYKGYGTKLLKESSDYFFENIENLHNIRLSIFFGNDFSLKCATKAGFIEVKEENQTMYKTYLKRK